MMESKEVEVMQTAIRDSLLEYARKQYGVEPEYLWKKYPNYAVLRHPDNRKWFAVIIDVPREKLGLAGSDYVDIVDVKCAPVMIGSLRETPGYLPAYHMNKENWLSILLDGSVPVEEICKLLDLSFDLTKKK